MDLNWKKAYETEYRQIFYLEYTGEYAHHITSSHCKCLTENQYRLYINYNHVSKEVVIYLFRGADGNQIYSLISPLDSFCLTAFFDELNTKISIDLI